MATLREIVVDCRNAPSLARFWAEVLDDYSVLPYDDAEIARLAALGLTPQSDPTVGLVGPGPIVYFQQVPDPKSTKNRLHLDVATSDVAAEVGRLTGLGASVLRAFDDHTVLQDPEGNEFCVVDRPV